MDAMNIESKFMRGIVSKLISRAIYKKLGYKVNIQINSISATIVDERAHIHLNADADMNTNEFLKATKIIGLED